MENKPQISEATKWLMLGTAIFFDVVSLVSLIPFVGWVLGWLVWLFATMTFWLWFKMAGMNFSKPKNVLGLAGGSVMEMIPYLNALPIWTATILYLTRIEKIVNKTVGQIPGGKIAQSVIKK